MAGEPNLGSAAVKLTVDKAQFAAEAKAAIVPGVEAAAKDASARLATATNTSGGAGIQKMIAEQKQLAAETLATSAAQRVEAAAFAAPAAQASTAATRLQGLGTAATQTARAVGGTAGQMAYLGSALSGPGGIAAGAAVGIVELQRLSQSMNDTSLSAKQLGDLAGKSGQDAAIALAVTSQAAVATRGGFSDLNGQLDELTQQGAAGIGTLLNMRDAMLAAGKDTSAIDTALEQFNATTITANATVARGAEYLALFGDQADQAAEATKRLETATRNQASAGSSLLTSQASVVSAQNRLRQARESLSNFGTEATGKSIREQRDEAQAVEDAAQRIVDAQDKIIDARQKVADAQEALAHAGEHERLAVQDAQDEVDAAQRKLNASTPEHRTEAQHGLEDAQQKLTDAKRALDSAKPDAEHALNDALRDLKDAERDATRANEDLIDAQLRQNESVKTVTKSHQDYQAAVDDVTEAQLALVQAQVDQKIKAEEFATGIKVGPVEALGILRQALRDLAADLDPSSELAQRIVYLLNSLTPYAIEQTFGSAGIGGRVARRASGGDVFGGQVFRGAEEGPELLMRDGLYQAPPGRSTVVNASDTAAMLGGGTRVVHHHTYNITVQAVKEPAERAIRRELERVAALAGG